MRKTVKKGLTQMEKEIMQFVSQGAENRKIAKEMFMSLDTVKSHMSTILRKLNAANRTHATYIAMKNKIVK